MVMNKDWSVFRVTILLYLLVLLFPINIFMASGLLKNTATESMTLSNLKVINDYVNDLALVRNNAVDQRMIRTVDTILSQINTDYISNPDFKVEQGMVNPQVEFGNLQRSWQHFKTGLNAADSFKDIVTQSAAVQKYIMKLVVAVDAVASLKRQASMNQLYISLIATMIIMVAMIYFVRVSMRTRLERHTIYDNETKLFNRDYFDAEIKKACALAIRKQHPIALIGVAIDNYEDTVAALDDRKYEQVIAMMGGLFQSLTRTSDTACRYEEDEFVIITPETSLEDAMIVAQRVHKRFLEHDFLLDHPISVSISVALQHENEEVPKLVKRLIKTLHDAVKKGNTILTSDVRQSS